MLELPSYLKSGDAARLIPVIADNRKEQRVASVFLATISAVPAFAEALMRSVSVRMGKRSVINTYTEVVFKQQSSTVKDRPDGLLEHSSGRATWSTLIEAKIGNAKIDEDQVQRYLQLARDNEVDAVITISNEFVARPAHSPVSVSKTLLRRVDLFHWSWKFILTEAFLLQEQSAISDPDQAYILREFIRFLDHDSIGVGGYDRMPSEWTDVIMHVQSGAALRKTSDDLQTVVGGWHQEIRDLSLKMSKYLTVSVSENLPRNHATNVEQRLKDDCEKFAGTAILSASLAVPGTVSDIQIEADVNSKTIRVGMELDAPQDKARTSARLGWLLRQISKYKGDKLFVRIKWPSRAKDTVLPVSAIRENPKLLDDNKSSAPRAFQVFLISDDARRFAGRNTFIQELENLVPRFYDEVGSNLQAWRPKHSKQLDKPAQNTNSPDATPPSNLESIPRGNNHSQLLEIPSFLRRI